MGEQNLGPCGLLVRMIKSKQNSARRWLWLALKIVVSGILIISISKKISFGEVSRHLLQVDALNLSLSFIFFGLVLTLVALRWHIASTRLIGLKIAFRYTWISQFYSLVLPGPAAIDVAKGVAMTANRDSRCATTLVSSILMERLTGLGCLVIVGLIAHSRQPIVFPVSQALTASTACIGMVLLAFFPSLLRLSLRPFQENARLRTLHEFACRLDRKVWLTTVFLSFAIIATNVTFYWTVYNAVGGGANWIQMGIYTCLDNLTMLLPVSVAGIGIRESLSVGLLAEGGDGVREVAFAWVVLFLGAMHGFIGFILQWRQLRKSRSSDKLRTQLIKSDRLELDQVPAPNTVPADS